MENKIMILFHYCDGMAEYSEYNLKKSRFDEIKSMCHSILDEMIELKEAFYDLNIKDTFDEFFDVWFCLFKLLFLIFLPYRWIKSPYLWLMVWIFIIPAATKYGTRYKNNGCIRSKRNHINPTHFCNFHN